MSGIGRVVVVREKLERPDLTSDQRDRRGYSIAHDKPGKMAMPIQQERRDNERVSRIRMHPYALSKLSGSDRVDLSEGRAITLNVSLGGMMLLLPQAVGERDVFEITAPSVADEKPTTKLVEVRWIRPLPVTGYSLHLVGVRFLFEPPFTEVQARQPHSH